MAGRILDLQFPTVNPSGATSAQGENIPTNPNMFGGFGARAAEEVGQGLERAGVTAIDFGIAKQNQLNQVDASDRLTKLTDAITDESTRYTSLAGRSALDALPDHKAKIKSLYDDALDQASNPAVKRMLAETGARTLDRYYGYAAAHSAREENVYSRKVAADNTLSRTNQAIWAYRNGDFAEWDRQRHNALAETRNYYELEGYDDKQIEAEVAKTNGKIVIDTTKLVLDHPQGGPGKASEFAKAHEGEIDAASNIAIDGMLKGARATMEGNAAADRALTGSKLPAGSVAGIPANFIAGIKGSEGFEPQAKWDYKQFTNGYGTRAAHSAEVVDKDTADRRFNSEIGRAAQFVDSVNPNLDPGTRAALTSLTFNAGEGWANSGLGQKVKAGDIPGAKELFLQYNKAGGAVNQGLADRRAREAAWFGQEDVAPGEAAQPAAYQAAGGPQAQAEAPQGAAVAGPGTAPQIDFRAAERRILNDPDLQNNPQAQAAAFARLNKIKQVTEGQAADEERARKLAEHEAKERSDTAELATMKDIYSNKPTITSANIIEAGEKGILTREAVERLIAHLGKGDTGEHAERTYGPGFFDAYKQVHAPPGDPGRITDPSQLYGMVGPHGSLTIAGVDKLVSEIAARRTPEGEAESAMKKEFLEKFARPKITWSNPDFKDFDKDGDERFLKFQAAFFPAYEKGRAAGLTPAQMLDPESKDYLGKLIPQFEGDQGDKFAAKIEAEPSWWESGWARLLESPRGEPPSASQAAPVATTPPSQHVNPTSIKSPTELKALIASKQISWDDAAKLAMERGWVKKPPLPPPQVPMSQ
jgi:lysozyme